jgi:hypothetical protein
MDQITKELGVIPGWARRIFSYPQHPEWFWGPLSLSSDRYRGIFPWG